MLEEIRAVSLFPINLSQTTALPSLDISASVTPTLIGFLLEDGQLWLEGMPAVDDGTSLAKAVRCDVMGTEENPGVV